MCGEQQSLSNSSMHLAENSNLVKVKKIVPSFEMFPIKTSVRTTIIVMEVIAVFLRVSL